MVSVVDADILTAGERHIKPVVLLFFPDKVHQFNNIINNNSKNNNNVNTFSASSSMKIH